MNNIEKLLIKIDQMKSNIWDPDNEPSEIVNLKKKKFVPSGTLPSMIYACLDVANGSNLLLMARDILLDEENNIQLCRSILKKFLVSMSSKYATWGLNNASEALVEATSVIDEINSRNVMIQLVDNFFVYNNKLWNWIDMSIPWFDFDKKMVLS